MSAADNLLPSYKTLEDLIANVDITTLATAASENVLQRWLEDHFYFEQAKVLNIERIRELDADELRLVLCEELRIDLMSLSDYDTRAIERALARHRKKLLLIDFDAGEPDGEIVENQTQLMKLLGREDCAVIYLCGGEFQIPSDKGSMTYIGREGAVVDIVARRPVDFDEAGIVFKNLTLSLRYLSPAEIKLEHSEKVRFVLGSRIALDENIRIRDVYAFIQGRDAFETFEAFARRAVSMRGIVIGEVLLEKADFDLDKNVFELRPRWRLEFIKPIKKFARGKFFGIIVDIDCAKKIFESERKQLTYADFGTEGSDAAIKAMYLQTETCGRILILLTDKPPAFAQMQGGSSSSSGRASSRMSGRASSAFGGGYGLELIAVPKPLRFDPVDDEDWDDDDADSERLDVNVFKAGFRP